ncbi:MAG: DUF305 domain-containing protein [Acidobacteria bacterium]|nr:DUF305 domain-containing protein [Acidobacteriota bacterium]
MTHRIAALSLMVVAAAGCRTAGVGPAPQIVQPGPPGGSSRPMSGGQAADLSKVQYTTADVQFMQGMIHHHLQALDMTALLAARTASEDMRKLGLRMELSQSDEIKMMQRWLEVRGQEVPGEHAHHMPGAPMMPGMLTAEEMDRLAETKGPAFDRLFLEGMIKHHGGALVMVDELFAKAGAGQDSEIFAFASDVVADQRAEIERMAAMLKELQK